MQNLLIKLEKTATDNNQILFGAYLYSKNPNISIKFFPFVYQNKQDLINRIDDYKKEISVKLHPNNNKILFLTDKQGERIINIK